MADDKKIALNLFAVLEDALFLGDRLRNSEFSLMMQPGQFLSPNLTEDDSSDDMWIQYDLANECVDTSFLYNPLVTNVGQVYSDILEFKALPNRPLTADELAEIEAIRVWLADNQDLYEIYRDRYFDAIEAYEIEVNKQNPSGALLRRLRQRRDDSLSNWNSLGKKRTTERKRARAAYLQSGDPSSLFDSFSSLLESQKREAPSRGEYLQTFLVPPVSEWNSASTSWGTFEKTFSESDTYNYSKSTSWSGRASGGWGLFSARAGASGSKTFTHQSSNATSIYVKFDYLRVRIQRPWFVSDVLAYKFWTWKKAVGYRTLSDGGNLALDPPVRPIGEMPVLPTHLIVARNVELTANFSESDRTYITSQINASASAGWGPFSFSGSYSESEKEEITSASFDGRTIRIQHPQIIGMTGRLVPECPNPNRSLPWQGDQTFGDEDEVAAMLASVRRDDYLYDTATEQYEDAVKEFRNKLSAEERSAFEAFMKFTRGEDTKG